jgi:hypothetical protein
MARTRFNAGPTKTRTPAPRSVSLLPVCLGVDDPPCHPSVLEWQDFLAGRTEADTAMRMTEHLDSCRLCIEVYSALPPPTYYSLGRPLPPLFALSPAEVGAHVRSLLSAIQSRQGQGGVFRVAGDWECESSLYLVLSLAITKLRHLGHSVAVCGEVFNTGELENPPETDYTVLLEAPAYRTWPSWAERRRGRLTLVAGPQFDWHGPVDFAISTSDGGWCQRAFKSYCATFRAVWKESSNPALRDALTLNALGVDCPPGWISVVQYSPLFAPVETQTGRSVAWWSVEGQWAAWESLRDLMTRRDLENLAHRLKAFPALARRLEVRTERRDIKT